MEKMMEEVYSKAVKAGKRTYFFDVKQTKSNDYYLTITESRKAKDEDGDLRYHKQKIFLYKEDFQNFVNGLVDTLSQIDNIRADTEEKSLSSFQEKE
jgi:hypothetical protein